MGTTKGSFKAYTSQGANFTSLYGIVNWSATTDFANNRWIIKVWVNLKHYALSTYQTKVAKITVGTETKSGLTAKAISYSGSSAKTSAWIGSSSSPFIFYKEFDSSTTIKISFYKSSTITYSGKAIKYFSGSAEVSLPTAYTSCGSPTTVTINKSIIKPDDDFTVTWEDASGGTNNAIAGYDIYYNVSSEPIAPTITVYTGKVSVGSEPTSYSFSLTSLPRGSYIIVGVVTRGAAGEAYNSSIKTSSTPLIVNSLPTAPTNISITATAEGIEGEVVDIPLGGSVQIAATSGTDLNNQTLLVWYSTSLNGAKVELTENSSTYTINNLTDFYFWTYDGLEYSSEYVTRRVLVSGPLVCGIEYIPGEGQKTEIKDGITLLKPDDIGQIKITLSGGTSGVPFKYTVKYGTISIAGETSENEVFITPENLPTGNFNFSVTVTQDGYEEQDGQILESSTGTFCVANTIATLGNLTVLNELLDESKPSDNYLNNLCLLSVGKTDASGNAPLATLDKLMYQIKTATTTITNIVEPNFVDNIHNFGSIDITSLPRNEAIEFTVTLYDKVGQERSITIGSITTATYKRVSLPIFNSGAKYAITDFNYYSSGETYQFLFPKSAFESELGLTYNLLVSGIGVARTDRDFSFDNFVLGSGLGTNGEIGENYVLNIGWGAIKEKIDGLPDEPISIFKLKEGTEDSLMNEDYEVTYLLTAVDPFGNTVTSDPISTVTRTILNVNTEVAPRFNFRNAPSWDTGATITVINSKNISPFVEDAENGGYVKTEIGDRVYYENYNETEHSEEIRYALATNSGVNINGNIIDSEKCINPLEYCILTLPVPADKNNYSNSNNTATVDENTESTETPKEYNDIQEYIVDFQFSDGSISYSIFGQELIFDYDLILSSGRQCYIQMPFYSGSVRNLNVVIKARDKTGLVSEAITYENALIQCPLTNLEFNYVNHNLSKDNGEIAPVLYISNLGFITNTGDYERDIRINGVWPSTQYKLLINPSDSTFTNPNVPNIDLAINRIDFQDVSEPNSENKNYKGTLNDIVSTELVRTFSYMPNDGALFNPYSQRTFMRLSISIPVSFDGNGYRYISSYVDFVSYAGTATLGIHKNQIGVNIEQPVYNDIMTIQQFGIATTEEKEYAPIWVGPSSDPVYSSFTILEDPDDSSKNPKFEIGDPVSVYREGGGKEFIGIIIYKSESQNSEGLKHYNYRLNILIDDDEYKINVAVPPEDPVLWIKALDKTRHIIRFLGTAPDNTPLTMTLDLATAHLDGVIIDGGTWGEI